MDLAVRRILRWRHWKKKREHRSSIFPIEGSRLQSTAFAESRGWTLPQMSLAWLLSRPAMSTIIAGADKPEHIAQNIKALDIKFTPEDLVEIDRLTLVDEDRSVAPVYRKLRPEKVHEFGPMQAAKAR